MQIGYALWDKGDWVSLSRRGDVIPAMEDQGISWGLPLDIKVRVETSAHFCYVSENGRAMQSRRLRESCRLGVHLFWISYALICISIRGDKPVIV